MSVLVNSEEGKLLVKVKIGGIPNYRLCSGLGKTKTTTLEYWPTRMALVCSMLDLITAEGAPYVFKQQQQQQHVRTCLAAANETVYALLEEAKGSHLTDSS